MSSVETANTRLNPGDVGAPTRPSQVSKIPLSYAAEVLRRRDELGWTLRDIAGWLTAKLGQNISHRTVDRFIASQQRKAARDAMKPHHELLMQDMEELREAIGEERRLADDTDEEIARARQKAPELVKDLEADHARSLRKIRSLLSQFNAYGKLVPKPDSLAVPVCTPDLSPFTRPAPILSDATIVAESDSPAVPVCTPVSDAFTQPELPAASSVAPSPVEASAAESDSPAVPVCTPAPGAFTGSEGVETRPVPTPPGPRPEDGPCITLMYTWSENCLMQQLEGIPTKNIYMEPCRERTPRMGWEYKEDRQPFHEAVIVDLSCDIRPLEWSELLVKAHPHLRSRLIYTVSDATPAKVKRRLEEVRMPANPVLKFPLTEKKTSEAIDAVRRATQEAQRKQLG